MGRRGGILQDTQTLPEIRAESLPRRSGSPSQKSGCTPYFPLQTDLRGLA